MNVIVSHPTGNANLRAVLRALDKEEMLCEFHTTLALPEGPAIVGQALKRRMGQRRFPEVPWGQTRLHPTREVVRLFARRFGPAALMQHETGWASVDSVYASLDRAVADRLRCNPPNAIYAYEDGALHSFRAAAEMGITRFYDLPIAHWRTLQQLLAEEAEHLPEWAPTMVGLRDSTAKHARKDEEIQLADQILVPSSFVAASLQRHIPKAPVSVIPFGCPPRLITHPSERKAGQPLELLYAGHLSQRKGLAYLIAALRMLDVDWRLTLAGTKCGAPPQELVSFLNEPRCRWLGVLPHATLMEAMTRAHVFVFPSIVEGMALVTTEALSAGLPIIATPNSGAELVLEDFNGFIVPIRDPNAIADRITRLAEDEPMRAIMAANALMTAAGSGWSAYEAGIARLAKERLG